MTRPARDPVLPSPPPDFPVYGLDASWPGSRWLESFGDRIGDPVSWVTLGHLSPGREFNVFTQTFGRPRTDAQVFQSGETPLQYVAHSAAHRLINVTLPEHSEPFPDGFLTALVEHSSGQAQQCARWPVVRWRVDGTMVDARIWRFAGGWAAVGDAVEGVYLAAVGLGADPGRLSLAVVRDGGAYHFGLGQPLHPRMLSEALEGEGGYEQRYLRRQEFHADQRQLLTSVLRVSSLP